MVKGKIIAVTKLVCLGQLMSFHKGKNKINKRIHRGWSNLCNLKVIYKGKVEMRKKAKTLQGATVTAIIHGVQQSRVRRNNKRKM